MVQKKNTAIIIIATTTGLPAEGAGRKALGRHKRHAALSACCYKVTANLGLVGGHMAVGGRGVRLLSGFLQGTETLAVSVSLSVKGEVGWWEEPRHSQGDAAAVVLELAGQHAAVQQVEVHQLDQVGEARTAVVQAVQQAVPVVHLQHGETVNDWLGRFSGGSKVGLAVRGVVLTGTIWKCLILCAWHSDSTKVFGLVWLSLSRKTLGGERRRSHFLSASTAPFFH